MNPGMYHGRLHLHIIWSLFGIVVFGGCPIIILPHLTNMSINLIWSSSRFYTIHRWSRLLNNMCMNPFFSVNQNVGLLVVVGKVYVCVHVWDTCVLWRCQRCAITWQRKHNHQPGSRASRLLTATSTHDRGRLTEHVPHCYGHDRTLV